MDDAVAETNRQSSLPAQPRVNNRHSFLLCSLREQPQVLSPPLLFSPTVPSPSADYLTGSSGSFPGPVEGRSAYRWGRGHVRRLHGGETGSGLAREQGLGSTRGGKLSTVNAVGYSSWLCAFGTTTGKSAASPNMETGKNPPHQLWFGGAIQSWLVETDPGVEKKLTHPGCSG